MSGWDTVNEDELEALLAFARSGSLRDAGKALCVSQHTVKARMHKLRTRVDIHCTVQLLLEAVKAGRISPEGTLARRPTPEVGAKSCLGRGDSDLPESGELASDPVISALPRHGIKITAVILARNEEGRIAECIRRLRGFCFQILVVDDSSEDRTAEIARELGAEVIPVGLRAVGPFDGLRNLALPHVKGDWILFVDADEWYPEALGQEILRRIREEGDTFDYAYLPFRHWFCGKVMDCWSGAGGYTRPQLFRKDCVHYREALHGGVEGKGREIAFPPDSERIIDHFSYDDVPQYVEKLAHYTRIEGMKLVEQGAPLGWDAALTRFVEQLHYYWDVRAARREGNRGFFLAFLSAVYPLLATAHAWDELRKEGKEPADTPMPGTVEELFRTVQRIHDVGAQRHLKQLEAVRHGDPEGSRAGPGTRSEEVREAASEKAAASAEPPLPLVVATPTGMSGYADEGRQAVLGLLEAGEVVAVLPLDWGPEDPGLNEWHAKSLAEVGVTPEELAARGAEILVHQTLPALQAPSPHARFNVARTMWETDTLPAEYVARLNRMDRVWVPSEFNRQVFITSGVIPDKVAVIPGSLDNARISMLEPLPRPITAPAERFVFLSVFDWSIHKGWDVLLEAFCREFDGDESRHLLIKTWSTQGLTLEAIQGEADTFLRERLGKGLADFPNVHLWQELLSSADLARLYVAADCFVLPTRGEGWCRPLMEAMAEGLPTIATGWSGLTSFHDARVGYPLAYRLAPVPDSVPEALRAFRASRWAEPDLEDLRRLLRRVVEHPEEAKRRADAGRQRIGNEFSRRAVTALLQQELATCRRLSAGKAEQPQVAAQAKSETRRSLFPRPIRVRMEGFVTPYSSIAKVTRNYALQMLAWGDIELSWSEPQTGWAQVDPGEDPRLAELFALRDRRLSGPPDVTIRHCFPPVWDPVQYGKLLMIQPWEYGYLPGKWVEGARNAHEIWAYSRFVRDVYVRSGVPAEKVHVVPLGFDPALYHPAAEFTWAGEGPLPQTRLLCVGGLQERKGADVLLDAYRRAFTRADDVVLLVKDMGTDSFYRGSPLSAAFRQAAASAEGPRILYTDQNLSEKQLASLLRGATCLPLPYRGEGFALPPLEAMACGVMPLVTAGGPTDDYLDDRVALRIPADRRSLGSRRIGSPELELECVGEPWMLEPSRDALVELLRQVHAHPEAVRQRGRLAARHAAAWTWDAAGQVMRERLESLLASREVRRTPPAATLWRPAA